MRKKKKMTVVSTKIFLRTSSFRVCISAKATCNKGETRCVHCRSISDERDDVKSMCENWVSYHMASSDPPSFYFYFFTHNPPLSHNQYSSSRSSSRSEKSIDGLLSRVSSSPSPWGTAIQTHQDKVCSHINITIQKKQKG